MCFCISSVIYPNELYGFGLNMISLLVKCASLMNGSAQLILVRMSLKQGQNKYKNLVIMSIAGG